MKPDLSDHTIGLNAAPRVPHQSTSLIVQANPNEANTTRSPDTLPESAKPPFGNDTSKLTFTLKPSGCCYDARMRFHAVINPTDDHPEDPRRIQKIFRTLESAGLVISNHVGGNSNSTLVRIPAREVFKSEVLLVHDLNHWDSMLATASLFL